MPGRCSALRTPCTVAAAASAGTAVAVGKAAARIPSRCMLCAPCRGLQHKLDAFEHDGWEVDSSANDWVELSLDPERELPETQRRAVITVWKEERETAFGSLIPITVVSLEIKEPPGDAS